MYEEEKPRNPPPTPMLTIKNTPYDVDEKYFVKIMTDIGMFLCDQYKHTDIVTPLEVMSQIAYIQDLTIQQKMYLAYWLGKHSDNLEYESYILSYVKHLYD